MIGKEYYDPALLRRQIELKTFQIRLGRQKKEDPEYNLDQTLNIRNIIIHKNFKVNPV